MKLILTLLFLSVQTFALDIVFNSGKENKINYAILHIIDTKPLICETIPDALEKKHYLCKIDRSVNKSLESKKLKLAAIDFYEKDKEFYIAIEPKVNSKLIPVEDFLYNTTEVLAKPTQKYYTHWIILLEEETLYAQEQVLNGLDFPVNFEKYKRPYVGALDLNGAPISYAQSKDIQLYLDIKREYENGMYDEVVKDVKKVLTLFPNSIFRSELELYSMRSMDKVLSALGEDSTSANFDLNDLITMAKRWSKEFTSDENIPEVFMLMAKTYLKMGSVSDANYFIDILVSEHAESTFTKKAILLFADNLFTKREKDKALKLYLDVLYSARDLDIASEAAIRLGDHQMDAGKLKEAKEYLLKVLNANANYLLKDKEESYKLAKRLKEHGLYDLAAKIADLLLRHLTKKDEMYEVLLKDSGDWHAKGNEVQEAYAKYQEYLAEYKLNGEFVTDVKESLDALFFKLNESNETKLANYYDKLIDTYASNPIGEKALIEKAKLLLKQGNFSDLLTMKEELLKVHGNYDEKPEELIYGAAKSLSLNYLKEGQCQETVGLIEEYKLIYDGNESEEKLFDCFMRLSRFERAEEISVAHLKDSKIENRFKWSQNEVEALYKMGHYQKVVDFKNDIIALSQSVKQKIALQTLRSLFFSMMKLQKIEDALSVADRIDKNYEHDFTAIDIYAEIMRYANDAKDDLMLTKYAQSILNLQKEFKSATLSPWVEFNYIEGLKRLGKEKEALDIAEVLLAQKLEVKDKIRAYYNAGELSLKNKNEQKAKEYFTQCVDNNETSSWKNICQENLKLF
jgi:tetratricopeptide (TPR) repeat protein